MFVAVAVVVFCMSLNCSVTLDNPLFVPSALSQQGRIFCCAYFMCRYSSFSNPSMVVLNSCNILVSGSSLSNLKCWIVIVYYLNVNHDVVKMNYS